MKQINPVRKFNRKFNPAGVILKYNPAKERQSIISNGLDFKDETILAVGAHPDDLDFGFGATIAKAASQGAKIYYLLATKGQRGSNDKNMTSDELSVLRANEQRRAAKVLGVKQVYFLNYNDGELVADIKLKEQIVIYIRKIKPSMVFTMDPSHFFYKEFGFVNHSDHRAIGEATLDACYPLARDWLSFPEHDALGLKPHKVKQLFFPSFDPEEANYFVDVTKTLKLKFRALKFHASQVGDMTAVRQRMTERARLLGRIINKTYAEAFIRLVLWQ